MRIVACPPADFMACLASLQASAAAVRRSPVAGPVRSGLRRTRAQPRCHHTLRLRASSEQPSTQQRTLANLDAVLGTPEAPPTPLVEPPAAPPALSVSSPETTDLWAPFAVPWDAATLVTGLVAVEVCFLGAGVLSPLLVLATSLPVLQSEMILTGAELMALVNAPDNYWRVFTTAEVLQTSAGGFVLWRLLVPHLPLPPGTMAFRVAPPEQPVATSAPERKRLRGPLPPRVEDSPASLVGTAALGVLAAMTGVAALTAVSYLLGLRGTEGAASTELISRALAGGPPGVAALILCTGVLAPAFEETVFRGFLMASLTKWVPTPVAVALSAAVFAAVHQHGAADTLQLLCMGTVAGMVYARTRNLAAPMLVHSGFNMFVLALYAAWTSA